MANLIQIKRSTTTASPGALANGELAYTANGDQLFIGSNSATIAIGGKRTPGVLTANQALVANATSAIDKVIVANAVLTGVYANGTFGAGGEVLKTNGTSVYWDVVSGGGGGTVTQVNTGIGLSGGPISTTGTISVLANTGIIANSTGVFANAAYIQTITVDNANNASYLGTVAAASFVQNTDSRTLSGNLTFTGTTSTFGNTVAVTFGNTTVNTQITRDLITTSNVVIRTNANVAGILNVTGNTVLGDATTDTLTITAAVSSNVLPSANITHNLGSTLMRWNEVHAQNVHSTYGYFDGNVQVGGDLVVMGNVTTTNVASVIISDPMIFLAGNNTTSDLVDIGFVAHYKPVGTDLHTGFIRHAADDIYYLFKGYTPELTGATTVNTADPSFALADLTAYLRSGGLVSNSSAVTITANSTLAVSLTANTLSLTTALGGTSGGTGLTSYTSQDILVANATNGFSKLALGTSGYVLQSNGTAVVYSTLDGGTF